MNQEPGDCVATHLGPQGLEVIAVEPVEHLPRLADRLDAVIAGHPHDVRLGLAESVHRKITAPRLHARRSRDAEYFRLKIFQPCSPSDSPCARSVL